MARLSLKEQIAVMQHVEDGGEVMVGEELITGTPAWNWGVTEYTIIPKKREIWEITYVSGKETILYSRSSSLEEFEKVLKSFRNTYHIGEEYKVHHYVEVE